MTSIHSLARPDPFPSFPPLLTSRSSSLLRLMSSTPRSPLLLPPLLPSIAQVPPSWAMSAPSKSASRDLPCKPPPPSAPRYAFRLSAHLSYLRFLLASSFFDSDLNGRTQDPSYFYSLTHPFFPLPLTQAQACTKKESLQLASRAVLAKLFPQATSLRQVIREGT